ncbi:hypothetical protein SAMN05216489_04784 [Streptomyces sp. 3213]|nr:hypothetical protein SAMN05216489_04784 [Streptomyces sp. 3213] [Streptomyces sp. 3213.3]
MRRAIVDDDAISRFDTLITQLSTWMRPLLHPARQQVAEALGVTVDSLYPAKPKDTFRDGPEPNGEVFVDENGCLFSITLRSDGRRRYLVDPEGGGRRQNEYTARIHAISADRNIESLEKVTECCSDTLGVPFSEYRYSSDEFDRLKSEGVPSAGTFSPDEVAPARTLADKGNRELATRIKQSYGLLVSDLNKKGNRDQSADITTARSALEEAGLISSEFMVICGRTSQQTTRAPSADVIQQMDKAGVKCACGKPISKERLEEALTITDLGRVLLDKSKWLSVLVMDELLQLGLTQDEIIIESTIGGDELDCIANISGEVCLFELKDKEFNLREAYSFGAKMNIVNPEHAVIVTSEYVGGDAKEHFERSRKAGRGSRGRLVTSESSEKPLVYIEGVDDLRAGLEEVVSTVHRSDAARALGEVLPFASVEASSVLSAIEAKRREGGRKASARSTTRASKRSSSPQPSTSQEGGQTGGQTRQPR